MANWYSDHFGVDGSADSAVADPVKVVSAGVGGARARIKRATITVTDTALGDVLWMFTMKSSDRLYALRVYTDGGFSASNSCELGLYTYNSTHNGAVLDVDLFGAALDLTSAVDAESTAETFAAGALGGEDRGKQLWELLAVGAGSDTVDPLVNYDVCMTLSADDDATASTLALVAEYTAGD
jgi:hypothetical protein